MRNGQASRLFEFAVKKAENEGRVRRAQQFYTNRIGEVKGQLIVIHGPIVVHL